MAITQPPAPTPAPTPPIQRGDRATFSDRVDATITWLTGAPAQIGNIAQITYQNALEAYSSAQAVSGAITAAQTAATSAQGSATTAQGASTSAQTAATSAQNASTAVTNYLAGQAASVIGYKALGTGAVTRSMQDKLIEDVSVLDYGATPGNANNTTQIQNTINAAGKARITGPRSVFNVTGTLSDILGADFDDNVQIVQNGVLYNTYARKEMIWGREHLFGLFNKLRAGQPVKILFSGDSTTVGTGLTDPNYKLDLLIGNGALLDGFSGVTTINSGHAGSHTGEWDAQYVAADIAASPDVFVLRWGANDPFHSRTLTEFAISLRNGLTKIRNAFPLSSGKSIVLMTPNSMSDNPNGRNELYFEEVRKVVRRAARDFRCAFIDTYGLFQNSRDAAGLWMDNPFNDGRAIHPTDVLNLSIASVLFDVMFPSLVRVQFRKPSEYAVTLQNGWVNYNAATKAPGYYRDAGGRVHLSGIIKGGATAIGTVIFQLPSWMRPRSQEFFPVLSASVDETVIMPGGIYIDTSGNVSIFRGVGAGYLSLSGISFVVG